MKVIIRLVLEPATDAALHGFEQVEAEEAVVLPAEHADMCDKEGVLLHLDDGRSSDVQLAVELLSCRRGGEIGGDMKFCMACELWPMTAMSPKSGSGGQDLGCGVSRTVEGALSPQPYTGASGTSFSGSPCWSWAHFPVPKRNSGSHGSSEQPVISNGDSGANAAAASATPPACAAGAAAAGAAGAAAGTRFHQGSSA